MPRVTRHALVLLLFALFPLWNLPRVAAADWAPVTDAEKNMTANPLDPGSGAVVLFKRGEMEVQKRNASLWETRIITYTRIKILADAGKDAGNVEIEAPKFLRMSKIEGRTILPSGEIVPLDASKVFRTISYESGRDFAMLATSFAFPSVEKGAILEYQTEQFQDWFFPQPWTFDTRELGTLQSTLRVSVGDELAMAQAPLDTNLNKINFTKRHTSLGDETTFTVENLRPLRTEPYSVPFYDRAVLIIFNPVEWVISGRVYPVIKSWNDVATELMDRYKEANKDNRQTAAKAKELTAKITDPRAKAEAIYKYLQQNIQSSNLGGVALTRPPDDLLKEKKGDPDDINLAFYTMLKEAKVDADFVLLATRNWQVLLPQFPNLPQFSRVIVRVNLKEGPMFADAADEAAPFGDLPWFEKGISGMTIDGTKLVPTPIPMGSPDENLSTSKFTAKLAGDWKVDGDIEVALKGHPAMDVRGRLIAEAPEKAEQSITDYFGFGRGDAVVSNLAHPDLKDTSQPLVLKAHLQDRVAPDGGTAGVLLNPWRGGQLRSPVFNSAQRQSILQFPGPEKQVTVSTWELPLEVRVEKLPAEVKMESEVADFSHSCTQSQSTVTCTRTYVLKKADFKDQQQNTYRAVKAFFDEVAQHDQEVILLRKQ